MSMDTVIGLAQLLMSGGRAVAARAMGSAAEAAWAEIKSSIDPSYHKDLERTDGRLDSKVAEQLAEQIADRLTSKNGERLREALSELQDAVIALPAPDRAKIVGIEANGELESLDIEGLEVALRSDTDITIAALGENTRTGPVKIRNVKIG